MNNYVFLKDPGVYPGATLLSKKDKGDYWQVTMKCADGVSLHSQRYYKQYHDERDLDDLVGKTFTLELNVNDRGYLQVSEISDVEDTQAVIDSVNTSDPLPQPTYPNSDVPF